MTSSDIIEAMARAMASSKAWPVVFSSGSGQELSRASLDALCAVIPGLSSVISGEAVIVPKEATDAMVIKSQEAAGISPAKSDNHPLANASRRQWSAMLSASPYAVDAPSDPLPR